MILKPKAKKAPKYQVCDLSKTLSDKISIEDNLKRNAGYCGEFEAERFLIVKKAECDLKKKIESQGVPLKDWDVNIYRGVLTGLNEAFIIDTETKERLCKEDKKSAEIIKPILRGKDIKRYRAEWAGLWLIFIPWHFPLHLDDSVVGYSKHAERSFMKEYPVVYRHLAGYKSRLSARNKAETNIRYEWYALQRCAASYYEEFEKEKVIWGEIVFDSAFFVDSDGYFPEATSFCMTGGNIKYLLAMLNSKLLTHVFKYFYAGGDLRGETFRYKKAFLVQLPIKQVSKTQQKPFEELVDKIQTYKLADKETTDLEARIDQMVYELYGLTDEEINIIEQFN